MLHFKQYIGHLDTQESLGSIGLEICFKLNESHRHENTLCNLYDTHVFLCTHGIWYFVPERKVFKIYRKSIRTMTIMLWLNVVFHPVVSKKFCSSEMESSSTLRWVKVAAKSLRLFDAAKQCQEERNS